MPPVKSGMKAIPPTSSSSLLFRHEEFNCGTLKIESSVAYFLYQQHQIWKIGWVGPPVSPEPELILDDSAITTEENDESS
jgi:hypothetical protein